ncbi:MAG: translocation/assembly module TamB domain-containing protein, partial [Abitibacteriaceae bacterium]|nr:translocation/assembly module TamB domain-containing protein [Abditibacteriaceae bacterium]
RRPKSPILNPNGTVTTPEDALVTVTGVLPVAVETPDLNAQVNITSERLPAIVDFLKEVQRTLGEQGQHVRWLERLLQSSKSLPAGLEGDFAVDSRITGSWRNPFFAVHLATLHNVRARAPSGGLQNLPAVDAAFTYSQGAVTVQKAELRLSKPPATGVQNAGSEAADEDTLLRIAEGGRIVPGGEISLDAEVLNANLSQLATWVPSLRDTNGQPALSGVLSQFSFQVGGNTDDPTVTGSITAEDLVYRKYTLDRLRVARFDIDNGQLAIRPGNLTIVKGSFQSSAASGFVSWSWNAPGPRPDGPMEVHLPLQRADFGALAGVFIPAITNVDAKAFSGMVNVTGTLDTPQLGGEVTIDDGRFRFNPATVAFDGGIAGLSGTVRFINGNQIAIEPTNILRGQLVTGASIQAAGTGNPTRVNSPTVTAVADKSPSKAVKRAILETKATPSNMTGAFTLRGDVALNLDPRLFTRAVVAMSEHRYNLAFSLDRANYGTDAFGGLHDISMGLIWRTGDGAPSTSQQVRWMLAAAGESAKKKAAGQVYSLAALTLAPDFATGFDALLRSKVTSFTNEQDFSDLPVYRRIAAPTLQDRRSRIAFQALGFNARDVGSGILDGTLLLDNQPSTLRTISPLLRTAQRSIATRLAAAHQSPFGIHEATAKIQPINDVVVTGTTASKVNTDAPPTADAPPQPTSHQQRLAQAAPNGAPEVDPGAAPPPGAQPAANGTLPIRVTGNLTLSQSQLAGVPAGAAGGPIALPDAPRLEVQLTIGHNVQFVTPTLRAELVGSIDINGTPRDPLVQGTVATRSGQVRFPNATARVTNGEITVAASRDPVTDTLRSRADIDATAVGRSGQYQITLTLRGPLDFSSENTQNLRVDVTSNPPLSQDEAFAQLLGTSLRELQG